MTSKQTRAQDDAREDFVWNMHTDYSGVAREAFDGGYEAGFAAAAPNATASAEYVYTVRSNKPLGLAVGLGNMPHVYHDETGWGGVARRDSPVHAESCGAAASVGLRMSLELIDEPRRDD